MWEMSNVAALTGDRHAGAVRGCLKAELLVQALEMLVALVHHRVLSLLHHLQMATRVTVPAWAVRVEVTGRGEREQGMDALPGLGLAVSGQGNG